MCRQHLGEVFVVVVVMFRSNKEEEVCQCLVF